MKSILFVVVIALCSILSQSLVINRESKRALELLDEATDGKNAILNDIYGSEIDIKSFDRSPENKVIKFKIALLCHDKFACVVLEKSQKNVLSVKSSEYLSDYKSALKACI